ncbi:hypothetical protein [Candidatus Mycoplasma haematohominis]|uniref:hypothetical protein n=1 Tax=Candidatus Mycoplasma haematohominis TaxID=1494318 RepID=UPI001C0A6A94|nr:hypothetical protein [Candidatus Mycoplasma haemohominis]
MASPLVIVGIGVLGTGVIGAASVGAYYLFNGSEEKKGETVAESGSVPGEGRQDAGSGGVSSGGDTGRGADQPSAEVTNGQERKSTDGGKHQTNEAGTEELRSA